MLKLISLTSFIFISTICFSQDEEAYVNRLTKAHCATPEHKYDNIEDVHHDNRIVQNKNAGYTQWPMRVHIARKSDGTGGISLGDVTKGIANLNFMYSDIGLEYYIADVNYIDDDLYYDFSDTLTYEIDLLNAHFVNDAVNVFFFNSVYVPGFGFACGYALYPGNSVYNARIIMDNQCTATAANGTFAHELGHHLNLPHTFNGTSGGNSHANAEHVPRTGSNSNCTTKGDYQCDTEADPKAPNSDITNCTYTGTATDIHGNVYTPPIDNVMSYYSDACGGIISAGQYNRCSNAMTTRLGHTAYDIDGAGPMTVNDPTGLTMTINGMTSITLDWTDNASNESGYLIERSIDQGANYYAMELAGVGPNITTYTDSDNILGNTVYCYRVKAVNDNANHYSNEVCDTTANIICGTETDLLFSGGALIQTPFDITGIPTTIPWCASNVPISVKVIGDFDNTWEITDILGEDGTTVLGTTGAPVLCSPTGATTNFNLTPSQYNAWAANGTITLYLAADPDVDDICSTSSVMGCADIEICDPCNNVNYTILPADITGDNLLFDDIRYISSSAQVIYDNITYRAEKSILLTGGFETTSGKTFIGEIGPCPF